MGPYPQSSLVITPAFRDLAGPNLDGPRFVVGFGGTLGNLYTLIDRLF